MVKSYKSQVESYKFNGGFTVLESIVAILVLSLSISGVFSAVRQSLSQATIAKDEVRAFYLAQEAVEIIRSQRDANRLESIATNNVVPWLKGIADVPSDPCFFGKVCRIDVVGTGGTFFHPCGYGWDSCEEIRQDSSTNIYAYSGNLTGLKREIQIEQVNSDEVIITVRVSWKKGLLTYEFKAKTHLFNWI
jgi:type II secretory pathway pseudopilin PulG